MADKNEEAKEWVNPVEPVIAATHDRTPHHARTYLPTHSCTCTRTQADTLSTLSTLSTHTKHTLSTHTHTKHTLSTH